MLRKVVLPAPLGPMMASFSPFDHVDVDVVGGHHAAETDDEAARLQEHLAGHRAASAVRRRFHMPIRPLGANRMMAISTRPRMSCQVLASFADA